MHCDSLHFTYEKTELFRFSLFLILSQHLKSMPLAYIQGPDLEPGQRYVKNDPPESPIVKDETHPDAPASRLPWEPGQNEPEPLTPGPAYSMALPG